MVIMAGGITPGGGDTPLGQGFTQYGLFQGII